MKARPTGSFFASSETAELYSVRPLTLGSIVGSITGKGGGASVALSRGEERAERKKGKKGKIAGVN